ncbi:MAG: uracil-DNA glycosylase [Candidatus Zambryskibacteria bacterium CG10_big_fil_rev_8_21_14_0_10_42_12]|uniref:Type-4 uracil-DNA glycosylase n=1 Tax=Candidatus Zambryskibacteria bacterium CG10_big_fil_rev_8_21_14_0_10_42_12 TaxID=1975115 RepID=A0A2H0QVR2_9BACT|nr:MAG: uracil-DNA glycosylase [Candidatus Zambryskibacteria bacterium CG10_big_fil_rev_8_21_14_0_10_42_12]
MSKTDLMRQIRDEVLNLRESSLYTYRTQNKYFPVIGDGDHDAEIIFIGEAPGKNEAMTGKPFCGASGRILDELLQSINLDRKTVYVTNIVKDRPPENRDPTPQEIELYAPFLDRQIEIIKPKVIATLGRFSMQYIMKRYGLDFELDAISKIHGKEFRTKTDIGEFTVIPLYHPAVAVYNGNTKDELKKDFTTLKKYV